MISEPTETGAQKLAGSKACKEVELSTRSSAQTRQKKIEEVIQTRVCITIDALAQEFGVTPQTIRRDINTLTNLERIQRFHGGAGLQSSTEYIASIDRQVLCLDEKQRIAQLVASCIPNSASLFISTGTTTEAVAQALCHHQRLRVITNNLNVASIMSSNDNFEVLVAGGLVRSNDGGIIGDLTIDFIQQFRVDYGIIGIAGIELDGTLLDFDRREVRVSRAIIENSRNVFLVADHTKIGRKATVRLGGVQEIDGLFTDRHLPQALVDALAVHDVGLYVVHA